MKKLYFDNNIIIDIKNLRNKSLAQKVNSLNREEYQIVFSPAHIEEIAATVMHHGQSAEGAAEKLEFLADLTDSTELLPFHRSDLELIKHDGIFVCKEHPISTYKRVIANYDNNATAEAHQKQKLSNGEAFESAHSVTSKETNNIDIANEIDYLKPKLHQIIINHYSALRTDSKFEDYIPRTPPECADLNFSYARNYFPIHEVMIEKLLEFLEVRRFYPDNPSQFISGLHDTTHATYAAYCDIFVTNDNKLKQKMGAAYQWLGIETTLLTPSEFIDYVSNQRCNA